MSTIKLSVHGLVDFLLRKGNIDDRIYNNETMAEGSRIHLRYQKIQENNYLKEVPLEVKTSLGEFTFEIIGRADGIILSSTPIIDEIKTTVQDLDKYYEEQKEWHLGQAMCYAYMYAYMNNLPRVGVRLTYISQNEDNDLEFDNKLIYNFSYSFKELEDYYLNLLNEYLYFYTSIDTHRKEFISNAGNIKFPYNNFREGQKELAKAVYATIINKQTIFIEAPTGIGKTMSTIFPSVKSFSTSNTEKIFYLSAKNIAKSVALNALKKLNESGLNIKGIKITAKEKMCVNSCISCNPDECPFCVGYYDKIRKAIEDIFLHEDIIDENKIFNYAAKYEICPFEYQLDVSLYCDAIICDYNYLFDPIVYFKRYFETEKTNYVALIDETHNLISRSRSMYSSSISMNDFKIIYEDIKKTKALRFKRYMRKLIKYLQEKYDSINDYYKEESDFDGNLYDLLTSVYKEEIVFASTYPNLITTKFKDLFRELNRFIKLSDYISKEFACYYEKKDNDLFIHIKCLDASNLIKDTLKKLKSSIFFSATLTPIEYYVNCLGGNDKTPLMKLPSPFPKENLITLIRDDISTKYKDRAYSYTQIADTIYHFISKKVGNYLVFFPSYAYLEEVFSRMKEDKNISYIKQVKDMEEKDKDLFLKNFSSSPNFTTLGFAVLGGAFSEGIDLDSDKLIGAIIIGVGLPTISYELDLIKDYYGSNEHNGYDYAYSNPGISKVIQAGGRVIRSENDVGALLFIDERYKTNRYLDLFKKQFRNSYFVKSNAEIDYYLEEFWQKHQK